jgi:hypothetical protein
MDESLSSRAISRAPWAVALLALLLFGLHQFAPAGSRKPRYLFWPTRLRLSPFPSMDRPLWGWLIRLLAGPVPGSAVVVAHGLSVVLGACGAGLLARLVEGSLVDRRIRTGTTLGPLAGADGRVGPGRQHSVLAGQQSRPSGPPGPGAVADRAKPAAALPVDRIRPWTLASGRRSMLWAWPNCRPCCCWPR